MFPLILPFMFSFNPILVWFYLVQSPVGMSGGVAIIFQSHFGLILSPLNRCWQRCSVFLSIPFWSDFIQERVIQYGRSAGSFQSHFGLILSQFYSLISGAAGIAFNPILVWFYQWTARSWPFLVKTFNPILVWFYLSDFSTSSAPIIAFQSHFGLILSLSRLLTWGCLFRLSIPFWSDFIQIDLSERAPI